MELLLHLQKLLTFFSKNNCESDIVLTRTVQILTTDKLVKLAMLWTTGPWTKCNAISYENTQKSFETLSIYIFKIFFHILNEPVHDKTYN